MSNTVDLEKEKYWKNYNFWFGVIGVIGTFIGVYSFYNNPKSNLKCTVLTNTSIIDLKADVSKLSITYDSINIIKSNLNVSMIVFEMKNFGDKNISINDYDPESPIGFKLSEGIILQKPELIASSNNTYFSNVINKFTSNTLDFKHKLIDNGNFYRIKLLVLHKKNSIPKLISYGKVAGIEKIEILNFIKSNPDDKINRYTKLISVLTVALISILSLLSLSLYKNNIIRSQKKIIIKSLEHEVELYKRLLDKSANKK
ncbi:hypothetical protein [Flavobacterium sp.]|uniref:hypothetical protein n=1 Tax=Flavobacterium sp. TaxID=239 RepID=UPI002B6F0733|nr:hypothetical protein [Flavobacterium sp.]HQA75010.1 hypothetical protein [Flavobacterium sp.]